MLKRYNLTRNLEDRAMSRGVTVSKVTVSKSGCTFERYGDPLEDF